MAITDTGLNRMAVIVGGGSPIPQTVAIGTGSATITTTDTALNNETDRNALSSIDTAVATEVVFISDFSASEISGTLLTEFGLFDSTSGTNLLQNEVIGSEQFAGDRELQVQMTWKYVRP